MSEIKTVYTMMRDLMEMLPLTTDKEEEKAIWKQLNYTVNFAQQKIINEAMGKIEGIENWKDGWPPQEASES